MNLHYRASIQIVATIIVFYPLKSKKILTIYSQGNEIFKVAGVTRRPLNKNKLAENVVE